MSRKEVIAFIRKNDPDYSLKLLKSCSEGALVMIKTTVELKLAEEKEKTTKK